MVNINSLERVRLPLQAVYVDHSRNSALDTQSQAELCPRHTMMENISNTFIPDRSQTGITMTAPTNRHQDVGDNYATDVPNLKKIRGRESISDGIWNVRTLRPAGKVEQLTHAMGRYHWNIKTCFPKAV